MTGLLRSGGLTATTVVFCLLCGTGVETLLGAEPEPITFEKTIALPGAELQGSILNAPQLVFSPDSKILAVSWEQKIACFDVATWKVLHTFPYRGLCRGLEFTPKNTELLAFVDDSNGSPVYSMKSGTQIGAVPLPNRAKEIHIHPSRRDSLFYCLRKQNFGRTEAGVVFYDGIRKQQLVAALPPTILDFYSSALSPTNGDLFAVSSDTSVYIVSTKRMRVLHEIPFLKRWPQLADGATLVPALQMTFSPDGGRLAASYRSGPGRIFDTKTGKVIPPFDQDDSPEFEPIGFLNDGKYLAVILPTSRFDLRYLGVMDVATGEVIARTAEPIEDLAYAALAPDGSQVAVTKSGKPRAESWSLPKLSSD